ncbi:MAG: hypothetical protein EBR93_04555 [Bacteroidetes bacterium]|nr:hypothetical protein [Bacteroidota bacterium]
MTNQAFQNVEQSFHSFVGLMGEKYRPWLYESPLFMSRDRIQFLQTSQEYMFRLMKYIADNYAEIEDLLPHDPAVKEFLKGLQGVPFQEGTFRTDFVINEQEEIRLIEVTCRFPLNSYFRSLAVSTLNGSRAYEEKYGIKTANYINPFLKKFLTWAGDAKRIVIIQGEDCRDNESFYLPSILEGSGVELDVCSFDDWLLHGATWAKDAAIIAELSFEEWLRVPIPLARDMLRQPFLNDPRLVFTVHDKGFFALVNRKEITDKVFRAEETAFIQQAFAETYLSDQHPEMWDDAAEHPEHWILKPRRLGRSVNIIAGSLSSAQEWQDALASARENHDMVLQKWHLSKKITGQVRGVAYEDYFAGTLLYWGRDFFGPGMYRASCYPISNVKDNRMVTSVIDLESEPAKYPDFQWI